MFNDHGDSCVKTFLSAASHNILDALACDVTVFALQLTRQGDWISARRVVQDGYVQDRQKHSNMASFRSSSCMPLTTFPTVPAAKGRCVER